MSFDEQTLSLLGDIGGGGGGAFEVETSVRGAEGRLELDDAMLKGWASGDLFGLSMNAEMGWDVGGMLGPEVLVMSTLGGMRGEDGQPIALGYHTGHYEVGLLVRAVAEVVKDGGGVPFAGYCSDPCDGRTQGTVGMFDSLAYRNDAAMVMRRLIRSLPRRDGVVGVATCDKGLPAMMMALAGFRELAGVIVPGGVALPPTVGEDAGTIQTIGARYAHGEIGLEEAAELGCKACATPGGGCQFMGTAATSQVVAEAMGLCVGHGALAPSGQEVWLDVARRSGRAVMMMNRKKMVLGDVLTDDAVWNGMVVHAAVGGSTNLLLHVPAIAHAAGLRVPKVEDWERINKEVPRLVDALPNGPVGHPTVRVYLAGGVPEVMLHLRDLGLLRLEAMTVCGVSVGEVLVWWERSERRAMVKAELKKRDGVDAGDVIMEPGRARERGLTSTVCFVRGNVAPDGGVIKATAIDARVVDEDGVYRKEGRARVFTREVDAIAAIKKQGVGRIEAGDVIVLAGRGPMGSGMEETYQLTSALKFLEFGREVALVTDARFSGVSTGACIGHVGPEGLAGGAIGKVKEGDVIRIVIDRVNLDGRVDLVRAVEEPGRELSEDEGAAVLAGREMNEGICADADLPSDTKLWAALQRVSGGTWGGCVYDVEKIVAVIEKGMAE